MSKRKALAPLFPAVPVAKRVTAAQLPLSLANRKVGELQKKMAEMQAELDACKNSLAQANESKNEAIQVVRAESGALQRMVQQLTVDNEKLVKGQAGKGQSAANPQLQQEVKGLQQNIQHLEEKLRRALWEGDDLGTKLQAEQQSRAQLITKLSEINDEKKSLSQQLQQLQQSDRSSPTFSDSQNLRKINSDLQHRIDFLCHENDVLRSAETCNSTKLEKSLNESNLNCKKLAEEKHRLAVELQRVKGEGEKLAAQVEQADWKSQMLKEQLDFCRKNSDMWQDQSRTLSEHLTRSNGGAIPMQQPLMQQPHAGYPAPSYLPPASLSGPYHAPFPSPSPRLRGSTTPSLPSTLICLEDELADVKKEVDYEYSGYGPSQ